MDRECLLSNEWDIDEYYSSDDDNHLGDLSYSLTDKVIDNQLDETCDTSEAATIQSLMELKSIHASDSSDSEEEINSHSRDKEGHFRLGQLFASIDDFYDFVKSYGICNMYKLDFVRKDKTRCRAKCVKDCPWLIYCSKVGNSETFKVKTFINSHSCQKEEVKEKIANTKWLGKMLIEEFRKHPYMTGEELKALVADKYNVIISISKAYRVKACVLESLDGDVAQQYLRLSDYGEELRRSNPGSTVELLVPKNSKDGHLRFDKIYICVDACRKGFHNGCRPLIALDGCFLTGFYRGELLAAIGLDGNNGLFIVAYAIVASETKNTWEWFLSNLLRDIGQTSIRGERWTFISDKGKGLGVCTREVVPFTIQPFLCTTHI